jgi:hypothetical protein
VAIAGGELLRRAIDNPIPRRACTTLFLPVHYRATRRQVGLQTTGGSDAFEPKMSPGPDLRHSSHPYALVFSVPLA